MYTPLSKPPSSAEEDRAEGVLAGVRRDSVGGPRVLLQRVVPVMLRSWTRQSQKKGHLRGVMPGTMIQQFVSKQGTHR